MKVEYSDVDPNSGEEVDMLLHRYFMPAYRKGYARYGPNKVLLPVAHLKFVDRIEDMKVRDSDIWAVSHPKTGLGSPATPWSTGIHFGGGMWTEPSHYSATTVGSMPHPHPARQMDENRPSLNHGTTWTQEMVWCIANNVDLEAAKKVVLAARFPFLDYSSLFDYSDIIPKKPELEKALPPFAYDSLKFIDELPSPRFIKTHLPWELLPKNIQSGASKPKIIYVARNAKDTCVSYFHHCQLMEGYTGNFEDFCKLFLGDAVCFAPFWSHILNFWKRRDQANILFLKYEDLKKDLPCEIRKTAKFLGKELTEEQVECLAEHLSFESMRNNPATNYEDAIEINHKFNLNPAEGHFMRSGRTGDYKEKMSPEMVARFDKWTEENLRDSELTFGALT